MVSRGRERERGGKERKREKGCREREGGEERGRGSGREGKYKPTSNTESLTFPLPSVVLNLPEGCSNLWEQCTWSPHRTPTSVLHLRVTVTICQMPNSTWVLRTEQNLGRHTQCWCSGRWEGRRHVRGKGKPPWRCEILSVGDRKEVCSQATRQRTIKLYDLCLVFSFVNVLWRQFWAPQDSRSLAQTGLSQGLRWARGDCDAGRCGLLVTYGTPSSLQKRRGNWTSHHPNITSLIDFSFCLMCLSGSRWHDKCEERVGEKGVYWDNLTREAMVVKGQPCPNYDELESIL